MDFQAEELAEIFNIFSNVKRIQIFWALNGRERSVNDLAQEINSSMQNTSQHLRLMKAINILDTRRNGQTIYYRIAESEVARYCCTLYPDKFPEQEQAIADALRQEDQPVLQDSETLA